MKGDPGALSSGRPALGRPAEPASRGLVWLQLAERRSQGLAQGLFLGHKSSLCEHLRHLGGGDGVLRQPERRGIRHRDTHREGCCITHMCAHTHICTHTHTYARTQR